MLGAPGAAPHEVYRYSPIISSSTRPWRSENARNAGARTIRSFQQLSCIPFWYPILVSTIRTIFCPALGQKIVTASRASRAMDAPFSMSRWACSGCIWENPRALPTRNMGSGITSVQSASRGTPQKLRSGHGCECQDFFAKTQPGLRF